MIMGPAELAQVEQKLSVERLAPYRTAASGDLSLAVRLYEWNTEISAALGSTLGHLEVLLRNTLSDTLTTWSAARFGEPRWYVDPGALLNYQAGRDIDTARRRATRGGRAETTGRVTAELTFGFWRYLLTGHYERTLWLGCLRPAFPGLYRQGMRRDVDAAVSELHQARNRMAHLEPMFNRPIGTLQTTALRVAGWICPTSRDWMDAQCRVPQLLARRPLP
ncbi:hypothetical protein BJ973_005158 [Actinoplanes tereljensis]|uniref:Abi-like protein n=1 Tax=Paractinoplanes tereljensis TaxID=571912 RepID=A0A919TUJ1_9ACTN|nr:hypothetical protein [Actinoplanes tereljensis]GIF21395.1 hypothetical protein Ate02nite_41250 [Actinoplanes tereljensis]